MAEDTPYANDIPVPSPPGYTAAPPTPVYFVCGKCFIGCLPPSGPSRTHEARSRRAGRWRRVGQGSGPLLAGLGRWGWRGGVASICRTHLSSFGGVRGAAGRGGAGRGGAEAWGPSHLFPFSLHCTACPAFSFPARDFLLVRNAQRMGMENARGQDCVIPLVPRSGCAAARCREDALVLPRPVLGPGNGCIACVKSSNSILIRPSGKPSTANKNI